MALQPDLSSPYSGQCSRDIRTVIIQRLWKNLFTEPEDIFAKELFIVISAHVCESLKHWIYVIFESYSTDEVGFKATRRNYELKGHTNHPNSVQSLDLFAGNEVSNVVLRKIFYHFLVLYFSLVDSG